MSGVGELLTRAGRVVGVRLTRRVGTVERWGDDSGSETPAPAHELTQNRLRVDGVIDRLTHARILEGAACGVDGDVEEPERGRGLEERVSLRRVTPALGVGFRYGEQIDVAALELGDRRAGVRDDARHERLGGIRSAIVRVVSREEHVIVVLP